MTVELAVNLFQLSFWIYMAATVCYIGYMLNRQNTLGKMGMILLIIGLAVHFGSLVTRTYAAERPPFLNLYEYLLSSVFGAILLYVILEYITKNKTLGSFAVPMITLFAFLTMRLPSDVNPTLPALRSAWRIPHISTAILGYAAFALAFGLALMYFARMRCERNEKSFWAQRLPSLNVLDTTIYRLVAFGFMMQTAMIITGAIWAQIAWGRWWGWDPKETWALITWIIYAVYLHMRTTGVLKGTWAAIAVIIGFMAVIFTLLGVSWLMKGLHSYA